MSHFLSAQDWLKQLASEAQFFRTDTSPSLEAVNALLDALNRPDESFVWRIIVGGTAGKGTTCRLVEDVLLRAGKKVAALASPHIQVITERIRINGQLISMEDFGVSLLKIKEVAEKISVTPTYYEAIVCAGIWAAKEAGCEIFIGEIGLGGRLDAVNAVRGKRIAAVTFIGDDHLERFGGKLENLAREKAGIFTKDSVGMLSYEQTFCSLFEKIAGMKIVFLKGVWKNLNKKLARNICRIVLGTSDFVMTNLKLPCRWEIIPLPPTPLLGGKRIKIVLDGAHSAPRFENILPKLKKIQRKKIGVLGLGKNHNPEVFKIIADQFDEIFWVKIPESRDAWDPQILKKTMRRGIVCPDAKSALDQAKKLGGTILVNSFFLGGEVRNLFYDPEKILEQQTEFPV